jgi:outer membrane protein OmpA-like peptidoglycan-associated protein
MLHRPRRLIILSGVIIAARSLCIHGAADTLTSVAPPVELRSTLSAATVGRFGFRVRAEVGYGVDPTLVTGINGRTAIRQLSDNRPVSASMAQMISGNARILFGLHRMADVEVSLPWYSDITGWGEVRHTLGDISIGGVFVPLPADRAVRAGIEAKVIVPVGNRENSFFPRNVYYLESDWLNPGTGNVTFHPDGFYVHPRLLVSLDLQKLAEVLPFTLHCNAGFITNGVWESMAIDGSLGIVMRPVSFLQIAIELAGEMRPLAPGRPVLNAIIDDPLRCVPSVSFDLPGAFTVMAAGEFGLSKGNPESRMNWHHNGYVYSTRAMPQYGVALAVVYHGRFHRKAAATSDKLTIVPDSPGDRDRDGIPDSLDRCPETPEDRDAFQNDDGCPDYDNDSDGVADEIDGCPDNPEDKDGFEDGDGCPDDDNDADRVPDSIDACPVDSGTEINRGCPENGDLTFVRTVLSSVTFEANKSKIVTGFKVLDRIVRAMLDNPKSAIEIQVHTDNRGTAASNSALSKSRAEALKLYIVSKGVRADRITALGLGSEFPITDNSTEKGRAKNQRVEIRRVE